MKTNTSKALVAVDRKVAFSQVRRLVVKVGTHVLANKNGSISRARVAALANGLCELKKRGIAQQREGLTNDDAIVTGQDPLNTLAILNSKKLTTTGTEPSDIVKIELYYDKAPETIQYFRFICGLLEKPIGNMRTFYNHRRIGLVLFKPNAKLFNRAILAEHTPVDKVNAFEIAVTNMSRKNLGMIGIRSREDATHGPTGEEFAATNVIGRVTGGFEALTKSKTDDLMYLQVINKPEM